MTTYTTKPGYHPIFRMTITLKNGKVIRRRNGRPFILWVKD